MWPTPGIGTTNAPPALGRAGRTLAGSGAVLLLIIVGTAWLSASGGHPKGATYTGAEAAQAQLWSFNGTDYESLATARAGPSSTSLDLGFDRARGAALAWAHGCSRLVMGFTGGCQSPVNQTWTWDGSAWVKAVTVSSPNEVGRGVMLYEGRLQQLAYVNGAGQAWAWTGAAWRMLDLKGGPHIELPGVLSKSPPSTFATGYDERRGLLVYALSDRTWTWDGATWASINGGIDLADAGSDPHLVYDTDQSELVYIGKHRTWTWDGASWRSFQQPDLSSGAVAYDPLRKRVVVVREDTDACDRAACAVATWTWDGQLWVHLSVEHPARVPLSRSSFFAPPLVFDDTRGVMLLLASAR